MKLLRALVGAALVPPILYLLLRIITAVVTGSGFNFSLLRIVGSVFLFVLPVTIAWLAATVLPLTRLFVRRGRATLGFMSCIGAACGLVTTLGLYAVLRADAPFPPDAREIFNLLVFAPAVGGLSTAAYWYLLDPPSYYGGSHKAPQS